MNAITHQLNKPTNKKMKTALHLLNYLFSFLTLKIIDNIMKNLLFLIALVLLSSQISMAQQPPPPTMEALSVVTAPSIELPTVPTEGNNELLNLINSGQAKSYTNEAGETVYKVSAKQLSKGFVAQLAESQTFTVAQDYTLTASDVNDPSIESVNRASEAATVTILKGDYPIEVSKIKIKIKLKFKKVTITIIIEF